MKVNVLSKKLVKPCTPTPENLKTYKLSSTDELSPLMNLSAILFYQPEICQNSKSDALEETLAKILPLFYPLAGREIHKDNLIDCNDQGAAFVVAQVDDINLVDLCIGSSDVDLQKLNHDLLPCQCLEVGEVTDPLLSIQLTTFKCGGVALSVSVSHRIFDGSSLGTFISALANASRFGMSTITPPRFDTPSLFPGNNLINSLNSHSLRKRDPRIIAKMFLFTKEAIASLRARINKPAASKVRVVTALIAKVLIGIDLKKFGQSRSCYIGLSVNMRGRTIPPLPNNLCGNLGLQAVQSIDANKTKDIGFDDLVCLVGESIDKTIQDCSEVFSREDGGESIIIDPALRTNEIIISGDTNVLWFSDWSKFGFYDTDFGWGNPIWASAGSMFADNIVVLMGNKEGDGIEAMVHLEQNYMPYFEQDEEIKSFCS